MAQEDRPYGGRIKVLADGSVMWDVQNRFFPTQRDTDGQIEYAIRVVTRERNVIASADGKCIVTVTDPPTGHLAFLIVSGYDTLPLPPDAAAVGRSYFITADWSPRGEQETRLPEYKVVLSFDDYDLEHAGLSRNTDATALELCHLVYHRVPAHHGIPVASGGVSPQFVLPGESPIGTGDVWEVTWDSVKDLGDAATPAARNLGPKIGGARSLVARGFTSPETVQLMLHGNTHHP